MRPGVCRLPPLRTARIVGRVRSLEQRLPWAAAQGPVVDPAAGQRLGLRRAVGQPDGEQPGRVRVEEGRLKVFVSLDVGWALARLQPGWR